jgi:hypothetical protein
VDPPALEQNNLTVTDSASYPRVNVIVDRLVINEASSSGEGCPGVGEGFVIHRKPAGFGVEVRYIELMHALMSLNFMCLCVYM